MGSRPNDSANALFFKGSVVPLAICQTRSISSFGTLAPSNDFKNTPKVPTTACAPAPKANSVPNSFPSSPGVCLCTPAILSPNSSAPLPAAAPVPIRIISPRNLAPRP